MRFIITIFCCFCLVVIHAQQIYFSDYERIDIRNTNYRLIGKYNGQYLIYKNNRSDHWITVYDAEMHAKAQVGLNFIPDRNTWVDCYPYHGGALLVYQYQQKNIVYCMGALIDASGKLAVPATVLDTTVLSVYTTDKKIYNTLVSDNKKYSMMVKIQQSSREGYAFKTLLFDSLFQKKQTVSFNYETKSPLREFVLDNSGNLIFSHPNLESGASENNHLFLCQLPAGKDSLKITKYKLSQLYLDEVHLKADVTNSRLVLTSFYSNTRRGAVNGLYFLTVDADSFEIQQQKIFEFSDALREEARGENSRQTAFDDYYIRQFYLKKDGGVVITAESNYSSNRNTGMGRWDAPFNWGGAWGGGWGFSPFGNMGWGMPGWNGTGTNIVRYFSDNIAVFSVDKEGNMQWNNVLTKSQFDDQSDRMLSFQTLNTGREILFLYNEWSRRSPILTVQTLNHEGKLTRQLPLRNMNSSYEFIIRDAKQVGARELLVPVIYRNVIGFARIDFAGK
ncbi:MAG: hypothetical protein KGP35_08955 [Bacteroidetes bacterium]|nr:hypothetical protein [Bacteroidota bacterium]